MGVTSLVQTNPVLGLLGTYLLGLSLEGKETMMKFIAGFACSSERWTTKEATRFKERCEHHCGPNIF